ncbi:MAG: hypothetical protein ACW98F_20205 [Candidatus Hodarchaeales archaeon]|jgi:hypothetical protein
MMSKIRSLKKQIVDIWSKHKDVCVKCGGDCCKENAAYPGHYVKEEFKFLEAVVLENIIRSPHHCSPCPFFDNGCIYEAEDRSAVCVEYGCDLLKSHFTDNELLKIADLSTELQQELKRNR